MTSCLIALFGFVLAPVCPAAIAAGAGAPRDTSALRLVLNLPAYRLDAVIDGRPAATVRVAIGARPHRTPVGRFAVTDVTWNPWWYPPRSPWARSDTITPPCPTNPMGVVKLGFGRGYFIHGTPSVASIGSAASHGCVRAANGDARALAELIVGHAQPDALPHVRAWAVSTTTRVLRLAVPVPLEIRYDLAEVRHDSLLLYPDVYRRSPATAARALIALRALAQAGVNPERVDDGRLLDLITRSRRRAVSMAIVDLLEPPLVTARPAAPSTGGIP